MTNRGILALAVIATGCLVLGARLLDQPSTLTAVLAAVVLVIGTGCAAAAVAGAWRPVTGPAAGSPTRPDQDPAPAPRSRRATR